jgi:hypothetical protein
MQFVNEYKQNLRTLAGNNGINPDAKFQTTERQARFPGANLHYLFTMVGIEKIDGIGKIKDSHKHSGMEVGIDANGNFTKNNYVTSCRRFRDTVQEEFRRAEQRGRTLVILDQESFLNRRLRAGEIEG